MNKKSSLQVISIPTLVQLRTPEGSLGMKRIMNIACGSNHSVAITEDGEVSKLLKFVNNNSLFLHAK